jgi:phenylalanyl-tRNA synthetase beta chain
MRTPVSWIRDYADLPADLSSDDLARRLTALGLKLESLERPGAEITGPLVVGRVLTLEPEPQKNGKTINWCTVDVGAANGTGEPQGIVCGAHNFAVGDLVVVVLPGGVLAGGFEISARKTYGHVSAGMICSARELGLGDDHDGIIVLPSDAGEPGDDVRGLLGLDEEVIEFEINPDRAYALSLRGVAREAALGFDAPYVDPALREVPDADDQGYPVRIEDPFGCPVFVARTVTDFDPASPTPDWLARRITLAGMRPISLAVDVTNYVMLELGRPIHGYDGDRLSGALVVRRAHEGERLTTLDGVERALSTEDLVVTDDSGVIGLGGVMGGATTEMSAATTTVVIESAHWDAVSMFRTGKRHRLTSEAGKRNERGVDPTICEVAADRVVELLTTYGGGSVAPGVTVVGTPPEQSGIRIADDLSGRVAGMPIGSEGVVSALEAVGCRVSADGHWLDVTPPPWRPDLVDPYDLVEEVVRLVGYDLVPSVLPAPPTGRGLTREQRLRRRVGRTLAALGCVEVVSFPFVGTTTYDDLGLPADDPLRRSVRLANPISSEEPLYTTTLLPGVLRAAARNLGRGAPGVSLFETGTVAFPVDRGPAPIYGVDWRPSAAELEKLFATLPVQPLFLAAVLAGERDPAGSWGPGRAADWSDAVEIVRGVATELGVEARVEAAERMPWHPGRCGRILAGERELGHAGELHPRVCRSFGLPRGTAALEIDLDRLMELAVDVPRAPSFSNQPLAKEDVALVVDESVPAAEVEAALREGAGELLESVRLFDVYTGTQVGEGRKSLAFALRFRAPDRTLTEAETAAARDAAVAAAAARVGAVQR